VVDRWADELLKVDPKTGKPRLQRINEVPTAHRSRVFARTLEKQSALTVQAVEKSVKEWADQTGQDFYRKGWQDAQNEFLHAADYAAVEAMRKENPQLYAELPAADPELHARYVAYGERQRQREQEQAAEPSRQEQRKLFQDSAQPMVEELRAKPRAAEIIRQSAQANPGIYDYTPEGLRNFLRDAGRALAQAETEARQEDPSVLAAEERRRAAAEREERGLPVPPATSGQPAGPPPSGDWRDHVRQGWAEDLRTVTR
jgi:hypothetical protein